MASKRTATGKKVKGKRVHSSSESTPGAKQSKGNAKAVRQADIQRLETELGSGFSQFLI